MPVPIPVMLLPIVTFGRPVMGGEPRGMSPTAARNGNIGLNSIDQAVPTCVRAPEAGVAADGEIWLLMLVSKMPTASDVGSETTD